MIRCRCLLHINVDVYPEGRSLVIGANGAGKSTMMKTHHGPGPHGPRQGDVRREKLNHVHAHKICKAGIAYVPEGREVFPNMTVLENLRRWAHTAAPARLRR